MTLRAVPRGVCRVEWIAPATGAVRSVETIDWAGGDLRVTTQTHTLDLALRMRASP